jgi:23S rRNA (adenine2030-N6)-methyltransferase
LRPDAYAALKKLSARDKRVKALALDGWTGLNAFLPPPERRGLVLVDPPFEKTDEFQTMAQTAQAAFRKWPQGVYIFWRPIKDLRASAQFVETLAATAPAPTLDLTLSIAPQPPTGLTQTGLTIVNPPFVLAQEAQRLMPLLTAALERAPGAGAFSINEFPQKQKA